MSYFQCKHVVIQPYRKQVKKSGARWFLSIRAREEYLFSHQPVLKWEKIGKDKLLLTEPALQGSVSILRLVMLNLLKLMTPQFLIYLWKREAADQHASNERRNFELQWFKSKSNYSIELVFKLKSNWKGPGVNCFLHGHLSHFYT